MPALARTRATCCAAYAGLMCGSSPDPLAGRASGGTSDGSVPSSFAAAARRSSIAVTQVRALGAEVGGRGGQRVVAVTSRGRPALEVLRLAREGLADQRGADDLAVAVDQGTVGLPGEHHLGDAGDREGVGEPEDDGQDDDHPDCRPDLADREAERRSWAWGASVQPMPGIWETSRSMSLMPTNGATMPPRP